MRIAISLASALLLLPTVIGTIPVAVAAEATPSMAAAAKLVDMLEMERMMDSMFSNMVSLFADNVIAAHQKDKTPAGYLEQLFANGRGGRERFATLLGEEFLTALRAKYPGTKATAAKEYAILDNGDRWSALTRLPNQLVHEYPLPRLQQYARFCEAWLAAEELRSIASSIARHAAQNLNIEVRP